MSLSRKFSNFFDSYNLYAIAEVGGEGNRREHHFYDNFSYKYKFGQIPFADETSLGEFYAKKEIWIQGTDDKDEIYGASNADMIMCGKGDDTLYGGGGSDTYFYAQGDGNDTIRDEGEKKDYDTLYLIDFNPYDVVLSRGSTHSSDGYDLYITVEATGERIQIDHHFYDDTFQDYSLECIQFANGEIWNKDQIEREARNSEMKKGIFPTIISDINDAFEFPTAVYYDQALETVLDTRSIQKASYTGEVWVDADIYQEAIIQSETFYEKINAFDFHHQDDFSF